MLLLIVVVSLIYAVYYSIQCFDAAAFGDRAIAMAELCHFLIQF